jgi:hypothetical protein
LAVPITTTHTTTQPSATASARATTSATAAAGPQIVAFLGDSYASGTGASVPSNSWANLVSLEQGWVE